MSQLSETQNEGSPSEQDESGSDEEDNIERSQEGGDGVRKKFKKMNARKRGLSAATQNITKGTPQLSFGRTDLVISVSIIMFVQTYRMTSKISNHISQEYIMLSMENIYRRAKQSQLSHKLKNLHLLKQKFGLFPMLHTIIDNI